MNDSRKVEVFLNRVTIAKSGDVVRLHCDDAEHAEQLFELVQELFHVSDSETCQHLEAEIEQLRARLAAIQRHYEVGVSEETAQSTEWWRKMTELIEGGA